MNTRAETHESQQSLCLHTVLQDVLLRCAVACEGRLEDMSVRKRVPFWRLLHVRFLLMYGDVTHGKERWFDVTDIRAFLHAETPGVEMSVTNLKLPLLYLLLYSWHTHTHTHTHKRHSSHATESFNKPIFVHMVKKFLSLRNSWIVHCLIDVYSNPSSSLCTLLVNGQG